MDALLNQEKEVIIRAFDKSPNDYWKTFSEIAAATAVKLEDVIKIVLSSEEFIESYYRTEEGQPLFTTRKVYMERTPFWRRLLAAFSDRVA